MAIEGYTILQVLGALLFGFGLGVMLAVWVLP